MTTSKVALITGAGKGLGFEIARQLGQRGITVVVAARDLAKAEQAAARLSAEGIRAEPVQLDVTSQSDIAALPGFFREQFGRLDILINNAGINLDSSGPVTPDSMRATFETNTVAPFAVTQALLPLLREAPAGRIVNHSSIMGSLSVMGNSAQASDEVTAPAYCASKAALNMLTVIQARQLAGTNLRVKAAHPGWVKTDMGTDAAPMEIIDGAKTAVALALLPDDGPTGEFFHLGQRLPW